MEDIKKILENKKTKKAPAYQWQDLALEIIKELSIPNFKKSSVFKLCKQHSQARVKQALIDTRELCQGPDKWKYFFKLMSKKKEE